MEGLFFYLSNDLHGVEPYCSFKAFKEMWGITSLTWHLSSWISWPTTSSSSFRILREYKFFFLYLWLCTNFSSLQKHNPFSLHSLNSCFLIDLIGLMSVLLKEFWVVLFGQLVRFVLGKLVVIVKLVLVEFGC